MVFNVSDGGDGNGFTYGVSDGGGWWLMVV